MLHSRNLEKTERIPAIVEGMLQGKTQQQIATDLGVSRMQIWRDRQTPLFRYFLDNWLNKYESALNDLIQSPETHNVIEATKELGRMIRALVPRQTVSMEKSEQEIKIVLHDFTQPPKKVEANQVVESESAS